MLQKILSGLAVVMLAVVILFLSLTRASLYIMAQEGNTSKLGKSEINLIYVNSEGDTSAEIYKLPETGILPDNMMYGFKAMRDYFWLAFSNGTNKPKIALLIADKKTAEFGKLLLKDKNDLAVESGNEAINKLKYAYELTTQLKGVDVQKKDLLRQIYLAGNAYKEVFSLENERYSLDPNKINTLINKINDWNKEQEKARYSWDY